MGKWIVPVSEESNPSDNIHEVFELTFNDNNITSEFWVSPRVESAPKAFSAGGYNSNYDTDFYVIGDLLFYGDTYTRWIGSYSTSILCHDYQIIRKPQSVNEYYTLFSHYVHHELSVLAYNTIIYDDVSGIATASDETVLRGYDWGFAGFAITDEQNSQRYLYAASIQGDGDGVEKFGSLSRWTISSTGISNGTEIISADDTDLRNEYFEAYNLELKINDNDKTVIAWINSVAGEGAADSLIVVTIDNDNPQYIPQVDMYGLNEGAIGGIEFSTYEDNMLYASCTDVGIVKVNYTTGEVVDTIVAGDYAHTFLQTAPDGYIYGVTNDGASLGRINMPDDSFEEEVFQFPYAGIETYKEFDGVKYYILPENQRVHSTMAVTEQIANVSCPGYADGTAIICVTGGTPGDDPEYTIICYPNLKIHKCKPLANSVL